MCEALNFLIVPLGDILKTAIGIALGTTLATVLVWVGLIGPLLRDNDRRKRDEETITEALQLVHAIDSSFDRIEREQEVKPEAHHVVGKVFELDTYVSQTLKASIPDLASTLAHPVNDLVTHTAGLNKFLKIGTGHDWLVELAQVSATLITPARNDCQRIVGTLDARKRQDIQRLFPREIEERIKKLREGLRCQRRKERQG